MKIKKYRKLPVVIEAIQCEEETLADIVNWIIQEGGFAEYMMMLGLRRPRIEVKTLEGIMQANVGDWIIKGIAGEFYPCRDDIFRKTYEEVA